MRPTERQAYNAQRAAIVAAGKRHDEAMTRIAERGGLTLEQMRALSYKKKDAFISYYRDGGPWEKGSHMVSGEII